MSFLWTSGLPRLTVYPVAAGLFIVSTVYGLLQWYSVWGARVLSSLLQVLLVSLSVVVVILFANAVATFPLTPNGHLFNVNLVISEMLIFVSGDFLEPRLSSKTKIHNRAKSGSARSTASYFVLV